MQSTNTLKKSFRSHSYLRYSYPFREHGGKYGDYSTFHQSLSIPASSRWYSISLRCPLW